MTEQMLARLKAESDKFTDADAKVAAVLRVLAESGNASEDDVAIACRAAVASNEAARDVESFFPTGFRSR